MQDILRSSFSDSYNSSRAGDNALGWLFPGITSLSNINLQTRIFFFYVVSLGRCLAVSYQSSVGKVSFYL